MCGAGCVRGMRVLSAECSACVRVRVRVRALRLYASVSSCGYGCGCACVRGCRHACRCVTKMAALETHRFSAFGYLLTSHAYPTRPAIATMNIPNRAIMEYAFEPQRMQRLGVSVFTRYLPGPKALHVKGGTPVQDSPDVLVS